MADIMMCQSTICPRISECYRYMAVPFEPVQAYGKFDSICYNDNFAWFYEIEHREIRTLPPTPLVEQTQEEQLEDISELPLP